LPILHLNTLRNISHLLSASKKIHLIFLFSILCFVNLEAQKPERWIKLGDQAYALNDFYGAFAYYQNAINQDSTKAEYQYKYAEAARGINNYAIAARFYEKVYRKERGRFYPDGAFHLANMLKQLGKYREASKYWKKARSKRKKDSYEYLKSQQEYKSTQWANLERDIAIENIELKAIPDPINSKNSEFAPVVGPDSILLFSALPQRSTATGKLMDDKGTIRIYSSAYKSSSGEWKNRNNASEQISDLGRNIGNGSFNHDKSVFYFSACDSLCHIYKSQIINGQVINPEKLNKNINTVGTSNTQAHYSKDEQGEYLYFVSDRPGGEGGLDIWKSTKINGDWSPAKNLGNVINSPDNEVTPFYVPEYKRLYFSSSWHFGFGGMDIHYVDRNERNQWGLVKNAGQPINTPANDLYFSIFQGKKGFLSSNRDGSNPWSSGTCCNDIYMFEMEELKKEPIDTLPTIANLSELAEYLPISLYFHNDEPNPKTMDTTTSQNYLSTWEKYRMLIPKYRQEYTKGIVSKEVELYDNLIVNFFDSIATKGVERLDFVSKLLLRELDKGSRIELAIKGYASPLAQGDYNKNLTLRRIQSLINYFNSYDNGIFRKYMNDVAPSGGFLGFKKIPFGETKADSNVSDNVNDQRNSVYSRSAALERKIEILAISESNKESIILEETIIQNLNFENEEESLGKIKRGRLLKHEFEFINDLGIPVKIDHVQPSCGCTVVDFPKNTFKSGEKGIIPLEIDTKELSKGKNSKSIIIIANDGEIVQELKVNFWVE